MIVTDRKLLDILVALLPTLKWLDAAQPIYLDQIPAEHIRALKQLEGLGLVYKRNAKTYGLQRERLKKILARASDPILSASLEQELFSSGLCSEVPSLINACDTASS